MFHPYPVFSYKMSFFEFLFTFEQPVFVTLYFHIQPVQYCLHFRDLLRKLTTLFDEELFSGRYGRISLLEHVHIVYQHLNRQARSTHTFDKFHPVTILLRVIAYSSSRTVYAWNKSYTLIVTQRVGRNVELFANFRYVQRNHLSLYNETVSQLVLCQLSDKHATEVTSKQMPSRGCNLCLISAH